jgi:hypothetical protein
VPEVSVVIEALQDLQEIPVSQASMDQEVCQVDEVEIPKAQLVPMATMVPLVFQDEKVSEAVMVESASKVNEVMMD